MKILRLLAVVVAGAVLAQVSVVSAVDYGGIGGRPAYPQADNPRTQSIFIYQLKPGEKKTDGVIVFNNTSTEQSIAIYAVDSVLSSGGAFACAQQVDQKKDVGDWVTTQAQSVTLAANSSQTVPFTVSVPSTAGVGEHDGCIVIQSAPGAGGSVTQSGVVLSFRSAIRVAVTVPGKIVKRLSIVSVTEKGPKNGSYTVTPTAQNTGNVSLDTTVRAQLVPLIGWGTVETRGVYPVLPSSKASWNFDLRRPFWGGLYRVRAAMTYNGNTADGIGSAANVSNVTEQLDGAVLVSAPEPLAGGVEVIAGLCVVALLALLVRHRLQARHVRRAWKIYTLDDGDTLESLAKDYHTSWKQIAKVNKLKPPYNLRTGQKLKLPSTD